MALEEKSSGQRKLEQLATSFHRKAGMDKTWLSGTNVLSLKTTLVSILPQLRLLKPKHLNQQAVVAVAVKLEAMEINNVQTLLKKQ